MTRRRSSPLGLELVLSVVLALVVLPLLSHGAPVQESHDLQRYSEGCYYNYNHYSEGDRILTNEPCLNCTCHNKMLMCYLRVCPFTKPIGHDCTVEKREDQCCPIVTCPEVPVDIAHHSHQLTTSAPGTELSIPEKYGCSIDNKFYVEGAQVPSNPNKPCELCYCIRNRTACLMQECTLHIDGCQPIYNKGSCCPVRYNCDHENELLEIEDFSTTTTTIRPTEGYLLPSTTSPSVTTDCVHNNEVYADGASITGKSSCEHCYCMRGDIVCAVQECEMPILESGAKTCRAVPPAAGECCPSNYICDDDSVTTEAAIADDAPTTITPIVQGNLHESVSQEDVKLQEHIDDKIPVTEAPEDSGEQEDAQKDEIIVTTISPIAGEVSHSAEQDIKNSEGEEEKPLLTTISAIKETSFETTQSLTEQSTTHKTEEGFESSHEDKEDESVHPPKEDEIINEENEDTSQAAATTVSPFVGDIQKADSIEDEVLPTRIPESSPEEGTTAHSIVEDDVKTQEEAEIVPSKEADVKHDQIESTPIPEDAVEDASTAATVDVKHPEIEDIATTLVPLDESPDVAKQPATETAISTDAELENVTPEASVPSKDHNEPQEKDEVSTELPAVAENVASSTLTSVNESEDVNKTPATEVTPQSDSISEIADEVTSVPSKPQIEPQETSSESVEFSEESAPGQEEIQDKIDENISEPSFDSSTSSPTYETITEGGDNIDTGVLETGDHKTESDLPKKKPKDEPESMEDIPVSSDVTKDEIPQVIVDISTSIPTASEVDSNEPATTKSSDFKDEETLDQSTQGTIEDKPTGEDEVPAVVEEITNAPISGDISDENDKLTPTTALPVKDGEGIEGQEEDLSTEPSGTEKRTTTSRPIRIHIDGEEDSSEIPTNASEEELVDSATSIPSIDEPIAAITEKEEVSAISPVVDSQKPSSEEVPVEKEEDATIKAPSEEENVKPEKETEFLTDELTTSTPLKASEPEHESETKVPFELEASSDGVEGKPHSDYTTVIPSIEDSEKDHVEKEQDKIESEQDISSTSVPAVTDSEPTSVVEEEQKPVAEQSSTDATTKKPLVDESEGISTEEYETKTEASIDHGETSVGQDNVQHDPELHLTSTDTPSKPIASEDSIHEEDQEGELDTDTIDLTTIIPSAVGSEIPSAEGDIQKTPEHGEETSDDKISAEIPSESGTTVRSEIEKQTEQGDTDSIVTLSPISNEQENTEGHKPTSTDEINKHEPSVQDISDSSTIVPYIDGSEEEVKQQTENISDDLTTVSPSASDSVVSSDEEVKEQPEHELIDSSTKTPISASPDQEVQPTTTSSSVVHSDAPISEAGDKDEDKETNEDALSNSTSSPADSETIGQVTDSPALPISGDIASPVPTIPELIESQEPTKEDAHDEQPIGETSVAPIGHSDKESVDTTEESYIPIHDIIPSAIPGEGDCLSNGETFQNNATVPTSSECEISCTCISSIIVCKRVQCYEPPKPNNCLLDEASTDKCCPQYICGVDSFAEGSRPTTTEEAEDEEIQFTTLAPSSKYPNLSTESATHKTEDDKPIDDEESSKTELPVSSDENITPVSIDFEQPTLTPEHPLSHVKVDEAEESSTKISDGEILVEGSTTTAQPITAKPTKQVTGDIEQPIEVTTLGPQSSKKPDEITTLGDTDDEELSSATPTSIDGVPSRSDSDKEPIKPVVPGEALTTEGTSEKEATTIQPIKPDVSTEASSVPAIIQTGDSTQSEEIPDTSDETSNESGEETQSEEDTKSPLPHKEEDQITTTSRPLVSEHVGDIEPLDESTKIPEIDYSKPAMPEDLSHTKVEEETPVKHTESVESVEDEQATDKIITTPASTILTRVEPTEDDVQKVDTADDISDKKDDIPSADPEEDKPNDDAPIHSTIAPIKSDETPVTEAITDSKKDEIEEHTLLPEPVLEGDSDLESHQTPSQTIAPTDEEDKPIAGTIVPEADEASADIEPSTSAPVMEHNLVEESDGNVSKEDSVDKQHDVASSTTSTVDETLAPVSSESSEQKDKTPIEADSPAISEQTTIVYSEMDEEIQGQTSAPPKEEQSEESGAHISEGKPVVEQNDIVSPTNIPNIEEQPSTSVSEEDNEIDVTTVIAAVEHTAEDEIVSQTSAPQTDKQPSTSDEEEIKIDVPTSPVMEGSGASISEDKIDVEQDEIASPTTTATVELQSSVSDIGEQDKTDLTKEEEGSGTPIPEDKTDVELVEPIVQTSTPAVEKQPSESDSDQQIKIDVTSSPVIDEDSVEGSGQTISDDKTDVKQDGVTTIPTIEKQPTVSDSEDEILIDVTSSPDVLEGSGAPISEDKTDTKGDENDNQTSSPAVDKHPVVSDSEDTNKLEGPSTDESGPIKAEEDSLNKEQMDTQTGVPLIEDNVTIAPVSGDAAHLPTSTISSMIDLESNEVISSQTNAPNVSSEEESNEDKTSVESQTDIPSHVSSSSSEEEEHIVDQTVAPVVGDKYGETDINEEQKPTTVLVQNSEKDKESEAVPVSTVVKDESTDDLEGSGESIPTKGIQSSDEEIGGTETPEKDTTSLPGDEYVGATITSSDKESSPSKDTSSVVSGDEYIGITESSAVSTPVKTIDENETSEEDKTSSTGIPIKTVHVDSTELPSTSTTAKPIEIVDEGLAITESLGDGVFSQTEAPLTSDGLTSEEDGSIDKNLITTESSLPSSDTVSPLTDIDSEDKIEQVQTVKPSIPTKQPELLDEETSTKSKEEGESINATEMPEIISSHEMTQQPGKLESDDQILIEGSATVKPDVPSQTESTAEEKKPSLEESQTTTKEPASIDASQTNVQPEKPDSSEEESAEETVTKTPQPIDASETNEHPDKPESDEEVLAEDITKKPSLDESQITTKVPATIDASQTNVQPEKPESSEEESAEETVTKTPQNIPSDQDVLSEVSKPEVVDRLQTDKPIDDTASTESLEEDEAIKETTSKPAEDVAPTKLEEQDNVKISSTAAPVDEQDITSPPVEAHVDSDNTYSTEKSDEDNEHTPKDDTNIQTIGQFVTERAEIITTVLPTKDEEHIPEDTISQESPEKPTEEKETPVVSTTSEANESEEKVQVTEAPAKIPAEDTSIPESEEKDQVTEVSAEIPSEDTKPQVQSTSKPESEELEEKDQVTEVSAEVPAEDTKPQDQSTGEPESEESEEKDQVTEVSAEIPSKDTKPQVQSTSKPESEESEEKDQVTEVLAEVSAEDTKPQDQSTSKPQSEESEEKDQAAEVPAEIPVEDTKPQVQSTSKPESEESEEKDQVTEVLAEVPAEDTKPQDQSTSKPQSEESEEKDQATEVPAEIPVEDTKPQVQSTSKPETQESEEKDQITEVSAEIPTEDTKPQVHPTSSAEESDEKTEAPGITPEFSEQPVTGATSESDNKTQAPETQPEITEEDHKQHVQPTEGAIASSTSEKPIEQTADDKIDSDLPKPNIQDEQPSSEDETPLSTTIHPLFPQIEQDHTSAPLNASDKDSSIPSVPTTEQPTAQAITNAPTHYQPPGYGQVPPQYPSYTEDEYTDEDETEVFGPGTCRYGGKLFVSAQQIPRDDPCDFCFCFRSDIICLQQSCPPPISGCHEEPISGFCCPRYECPVSMATTLNITTSTTTTSTTLPPHFLHHAYRGAAAKNGCHINGKSYKVGDKIDSASGPCMHCTCGGDGQMKCDPKTCSPEPMLRQMIAVVASRRR
ncbi:mucin-2 [Eupeodes corollae]|uniref:mucin-2 n=1 Tax=Eupeodes corollae TaxID=290404 RepID=UPI002491DA2C|nr:mucin-2 [Eupeodes corollae]